jgi:hypothetical protein
MAGATLTTLSNIMKNFYLGPVQTQFNNEILVNQLLGVSSENLVGLQAVLPLHTSRTGGIGSRGELETLPAAGNQSYSAGHLRPRVPLRSRTGLGPGDPQDQLLGWCVPSGDEVGAGRSS